MQAINMFPNPISHVRELRPHDDMDDFMDTFDSAITVSAESWERWSMRNDVKECRFDCEDYMLMSFIGLSTYMTDPYNKADLLEGAYFLGCIFYGSEEGYLEWYLDLHATL